MWYYTARKNKSFLGVKFLTSIDFLCLLKPAIHWDRACTSKTPNRSEVAEMAFAVL